MRFNLITNLTNGCGLQRDYELLRGLLEGWGHEVHGIQFNQPHAVGADVNIFLETVVPTLFPLAPKQWVFPNPEWWFPHYDQVIHSVDILCKTRDAFRLFQKKSARVRYVGFLSRDLYHPEIPKKPRWLHVAGNSMVKNTEAILEAFAELPLELTLISYWRKSALANISWLRRVNDEELAAIMNEHQFHLCPSQYEGFGHYLHEGQGVGAVVITTTAPPFDEFGAPLTMPAFPVGQLRLATMHKVSKDSVKAVVEKALSTDKVILEEWSQQARQRFLQQNQEFRDNMARVMEDLC